MTSNETADARRLTITRTYEAPRDLVHRAWTDGAALARWWGPRGATLEVVTADIRPGGVFHFAMVAEGQETTWGRLAYREVTPERIALVSSFADARGDVVPVPFMADFPLELLVTATFVEAAGRTTVTLDVAPLSASPAEQTAFESLLPSMEEGFGHALGVLTQELRR
ncbi:MAG: SRPBCC domain-containing protein [Dehalococcoidia bacterium]